MKTIKLIMLTLTLSTLIISCGESEQERIEREAMENMERLSREADSISNYYEKYQDSINYQNKIDEMNAETELEILKIRN